MVAGEGGLQDRVQPGESGEVEFVASAIRIGPGGRQGEAGLGDGRPACDIVLSGLRLRVLEGFDGTGEVALGPVDVARCWLSRSVLPMYDSP
ncbi:hypothetical protein AVL59_24470 [Streptomyces griseochromogenes]|uniref:Uncharacterized protein n=1 Tax=Streptomyces griseochromogenes TaxID=68214 RepID=A0A1B1B0J4_9ACTN|nr:hypothetical protein AVL59_24470 [Streptomyces griseochromogenes]